MLAPALATEANTRNMFGVERRRGIAIKDATVTVIAAMERLAPVRSIAISVDIWSGVSSEPPSSSGSGMMPRIVDDDVKKNLSWRLVEGVCGN